MNGLKTTCMKVERLVFLDSVYFLPCPLRKLPEAFGFTTSETWYPHNFNTEESLNHTGAKPDDSYYDLNEKKKGQKGFSRVVREPEIGAYFRQHARAGNLLL